MEDIKALHLVQSLKGQQKLNRQDYLYLNKCHSMNFIHAKENIILTKSGSNGAELIVLFPQAPTWLRKLQGTMNVFLRELKTYFMWA